MNTADAALHAELADIWRDVDRDETVNAIILTGAGATMQPLFELEGISGFIEKPFDLTNLQGKVEHILRVR